MTVGKTRNVEWHERLKQKRREWQAKRRAALANNPRIQAMKLALKERRHAAYEKTKAYRKTVVAKQKLARGEHKAEERAQRDAALRETLRPATKP